MYDFDLNPPETDLDAITLGAPGKWPDLTLDGEPDPLPQGNSYTLTRTLYAEHEAGTKILEVTEVAWQSWGPVFRAAVWALLNRAAVDWCAEPELSCLRRNNGPLTLRMFGPHGTISSVTIDPADLPVSVPSTIVLEADDPVIRAGHQLFGRTTCWADGRQVRGVSVDVTTAVAETESGELVPVEVRIDDTYGCDAWRYLPPKVSDRVRVVATNDSSS